MVVIYISKFPVSHLLYVTLLAPRILRFLCFWTNVCTSAVYNGDPSAWLDLIILQYCFLTLFVNVCVCVRFEFTHLISYSLLIAAVLILTLHQSKTQVYSRVWAHRMGAPGLKSEEKSLCPNPDPSVILITCHQDLFSDVTVLMTTDTYSTSTYPCLACSYRGGPFAGSVVLDKGNVSLWF